MRIMPSGRARVSTRRPQAIGECPRCGFWRNRVDLIEQYQWAGNKLIYTGIDVCKDTCLDEPQEQFRTPILPPDPIPLRKPWPSPNVTLPSTIGAPPQPSPDYQGFSTFILGFQSGTAYAEGASTPGTYPTLQSQVLTAVADASGTPTPPFGDLAAYIVTMAGDFTVPLVPTNSQRNFLLVYNPTQMPAQISTGNASQGAISNISIGPGQALYWATAQGLAPVYTGALTAVGLYKGLPLWAWEASTQFAANLINDTGVLQVTSTVQGWPTSPAGLPAGAVWSDGLAVAVVPGVVPNPTAPKIFFGSITAATLLATGGGNLPLTDPGNTFQLWNNGGLVCVSLGPLGPSLDFSQASNSQYIPVVL